MRFALQLHVALLGAAAGAAAQERTSAFSITGPPVKPEPGLHDLGIFTGLPNKAFKPDRLDCCTARNGDLWKSHPLRTAANVRS